MYIQFSYFCKINSDKILTFQVFIAKTVTSTLTGSIV